MGHLESDCQNLCTCSIYKGLFLAQHPSVPDSQYLINAPLATRNILKWTECTGSHEGLPELTQHFGRSFLPCKDDFWMCPDVPNLNTLLPLVTIFYFGFYGLGSLWFENREAEGWGIDKCHKGVLFRVTKMIKGMISCFKSVWRRWEKGGWGIMFELYKNHRSGKWGNCFLPIKKKNQQKIPVVKTGKFGGIPWISTQPACY